MVELLEEKKKLFEKYSKQIDELYAFRDRFYLLNQNTTNSDERNAELNKRLSEIAHELENIETSQFESKACHLILIGKAFNVLPDYNQRSFDALTKAIKLDPKSVEAWNYLGECYWKKRDFDMCRKCFENSSKIQPNKLSLRGLAMVTRQLINVPVNKEQLQKHQQQQPQPSVSSATEAASETKTTTTTSSSTTEAATTAKNVVKNLLDESIDYAKESLKLDAKDGMSWYILGNCYMAKFFSPFGQQNTSLLKQALSAYQLAMKDDAVASLQSDLYFNKSMLSMYEENWQDALECLSKAYELDPYWSEIKENLNGILHYLTQMNEMVDKKGKLKTKKFQALLESIQQQPQQQQHKSDLGPYADGGFYRAKSSNDPNPERIELKECTLSELNKGMNSKKLLIGKVISGSPTKYSDTSNLICFSCCIADSNGDCASLTIYNLAAGEGLIIGHTVAIPEPWIEQIDIKFNMPASMKKRLGPDDKFDQDTYEFKFTSVRIENPAVLVVNGKKWTKAKVSSSFFVPKILAD